MPNVLEDLASGIVVTEFDSDTGIATVANVSGWLFENLGQVNTYLYTDFDGAAATGLRLVCSLQRRRLHRQRVLLVCSRFSCGRFSCGLLIRAPCRRDRAPGEAGVYYKDGTA